MGVSPVTAIAATAGGAIAGAGVTAAVIPYQKRHPHSPALLGVTGVGVLAFDAGLIWGASTPDPWKGAAVFGAAAGFVAGHATALGVAALLLQGHGESGTK
jgi:hypothetical protein